MSKAEEARKQYRRYIAAHEAVEQTKPDMIEMIYKEATPVDGVPDKGTEGYFLYDPVDDLIRIIPQRGNSSDYVYLKSKDVPALIVALRKFFE